MNDEDDPPPFKLTYNRGKTPEQIEGAEVRRMTEKTRERLERKNQNVWSMARQFYEKWISEDDSVTIQEMERLAKQAWNAAETYWTFVETRQQDDISED